MCGRGCARDGELKPSPTPSLQCTLTLLPLYLSSSHQSGVWGPCERAAGCHDQGDSLQHAALQSASLPHSSVDSGNCCHCMLCCSNSALTSLYCTGHGAVRLCKRQRQGPTECFHGSGIVTSPNVLYGVQQLHAVFNNNCIISTLARFYVTSATSADTRTAKEQQ